MRYLKSKQADDILTDEIFCKAYDTFEGIVEEISSIDDTLQDYFDKEQINDKDKIIERVCKKMEALKESVIEDGEKFNNLEIDATEAMEHAAICNEIYNTLEVNRLMKKLK